MFDGDCTSDRSVYFSDRVVCRIQTTGSANLREVKAVSQWARLSPTESKSVRVGEKETFVVVINFGIANIEDRVKLFVCVKASVWLVTAICIGAGCVCRANSVSSAGGNYFDRVDWPNHNSYAELRVSLCQA